MEFEKQPYALIRAVQEGTRNPVSRIISGMVLTHCCFASTHFNKMAEYSTLCRYSSIGRAIALFVKLYKINMNNDLSTKAKGNLTELQCITAFYELGYQVSIPYGENSRYDFIADVNGKLIRVQVKTSSPCKDTDGAIKFSTRSTRINSNKNISHSYTENEIDYFATYWNNKCYLIPINETASCEKTLRFVPPKNGQIKGIKFADEYELAKQLKIILEV